MQSDLREYKGGNSDITITRKQTEATTAKIVEDNKLPPTEWFVARRILRSQSDHRVWRLNTSERMMLS